MDKTSVVVFEVSMICFKANIHVATLCLQHVAENRKLSGNMLQAKKHAATMYLQQQFTCNISAACCREKVAKCTCIYVRDHFKTTSPF